MTEIFFQGFALQASLILALGAQNIFVLNSGLSKQRHLFVAFVSSVCDVILIFIGVAGVATIFLRTPILKIGLGIIGVAFLFYYGFMKLREANKASFDFTTSESKISRKQALMTSLGFSLLNPHVYLDTIVLIGGYSSKFYSIYERFLFGAGASIFSTIWFCGLSLMASFASKLLSSSQVMRLICLVSGVILIGLSIKLGCDVYSWAATPSRLE